MAYQRTMERMYFAIIYENRPFYKKKQELIKDIKAEMNRLVVFLGENKFVAGDNITWADFVIAQFFDSLSRLEPSFKTDFKTVAELQERVFNLNGVKEYLSSEVYRNRVTDFKAELSWQ